MAHRIDQESALFWAEHIEQQKKSYLSVPDYCKKNNLSKSKMNQKIYVILYKKYSKPLQYQEELELFNDYKNSGLLLSEFCKINKVNERYLKQMQTHLGYVEFLEKTQKTDLILYESALEPQQPMMFNKVNPKSITSLQDSQTTPPIVQQSELLEKQNDIELVISKGIKVLISPQVDSMKIIKIIELLKDL